MAIPRSANTLAFLAVMPAQAFALAMAKEDDFVFLAVITAGMMMTLVALLINYCRYIRKTPLVRIDQRSLVFFGDSRWQRRSFRRHTTSAISLSRRPLFWRSSYRLEAFPSKFIE